MNKSAARFAALSRSVGESVGESVRESVRESECVGFILRPGRPFALPSGEGRMGALDTGGIA